MKKEYAPISYLPLAGGTGFVHPPELPEVVHLDSPAVAVMTDFQYVRPVTTRPDVIIDDALSKMKNAGVRLLLVLHEDGRIAGTVTAKILLGEAPVQIVQEKRIPRREITVGMVMTPAAKVVALDMINVRNATVGHIVKTLQQLDRKHILIVEADEQTKEQSVRGLFSTSQIGRQLGVNVIPETPAAQTLAEIQQLLG